MGRSKVSLNDTCVWCCETKPLKNGLMTSDGELVCAKCVKELEAEQDKLDD